MHAGGSQVPSFQQKRENFEFAHSGMLPRNEPSTPDFLPRSFPGVPACELAAQPGPQDAGIVSARAPEIGFFAFWRTPLWETENAESVQKRSVTVLNVILCVYECITTYGGPRRHPRNFDLDFKSSATQIITSAA